MRKEVHEPPALPLTWLEQPVCLEWAVKDGEESSLPRRPAGSPLWLIGTVARALRTRQGRTR